MPQKPVLCGERHVAIAVCETVGVFNTGAASKATLMQLCGVTPGRNMLKALRKEDHERIVFAGHKVSTRYRKQAGAAVKEEEQS